MPYSVSIDPRESCIACCNCHTNCPEVFEMNPDGFSCIKENYRNDPTSLEEGTVPDNLKDCAEGAANMCPVSIIYVKKK